MIIEKEKTRLFSTINAAIQTEAEPSAVLERLSITPEFNSYPFEMLVRLKHTPQHPVHHPEGDVWKHTMLVLDEAAKVRGQSSSPRAFMWAALLHDIGKPGTTKMRRGKMTAYDHDKLGAELALEFLTALTDDHDFAVEVASLVRWHMQILFVVKDMPLADISAMKSQTDINEIALLGLCDRLGRLDVDKEAEYENIREFLRKVQVM